MEKEGSVLGDLQDSITPHFESVDGTLYHGDTLEVLRGLPAASVHCAVTSPPYWGLRDYGTGTWKGGDPACNHQEGYRDACLKCGAVRADHQIGLEKTLDCLGWATKKPCGACYCCRMVEVFREVQRVLRNDGTCWMVIGDSYTSGGRTNRDPGQSKPHPAFEGEAYPDGLRPGTPPGLKPKDLCLVPARLALALQADGWWIRSEIIWAKLNPMPESVRDRCTRAHETIWMMSKSQKYFYDQEAVRQPVAISTISRGPADFGGAKYRNYTPAPDDPKFRNGNHQWGRTFDYRESSARGANLRDVWTLSVEPYPDAHFACFPTEIPRRAIRAGTSIKGVCSTCGAPWKRIVKCNGISPRAPKKEYNSKSLTNDLQHSYRRMLFNTKAAREAGGDHNSPFPGYQTMGWAPTCSCPEIDPVPATVLDPFMGSGTTAMVAHQEGRRWIGIELSPVYCALVQKRIDSAPQLSIVL